MTGNNYEEPGENLVLNRPSDQMPATALATLEDVGALTPIGLTLSASTTPEQFVALARTVSKAQTMLAWIRGDMIVFAEMMWGQEAYQYLEEMDGSEMSKSQWGRVATQFPIGRRFEALSWSHHREVVALEPADQDRLLRAAAANHWARNRLADEVRELRPPREAATGYVVEAVCEAAEAIWDHAGEEAKDLTCVPTEFVDALGIALGKIE